MVRKPEDLNKSFSIMVIILLQLRTQQQKNLHVTDAKAYKRRDLKGTFGSLNRIYREMSRISIL